MTLDVGGGGSERGGERGEQDEEGVSVTPP